MRIYIHGARVRVKGTERSNRELEQREQRERKNNSGGGKKNSKRKRTSVSVSLLGFV